MRTAGDTSPDLRITESIAAELARGGAAVALETTVVTHGLPRGVGVPVALELEAIVRKSGAMPATIGVWNGSARVGLAPEELDALAAPGAALKLNPGNLAAALATGQSGSTTVASTMWIAWLAGIEVLATGGIGGVHRGDGADESADLAALARFPVAVVCSGAKAVLDLPRTRERLETLGVPIYGLGTSELPAFYRRGSGLPVDHAFHGEEPLAAAIATHWALGGAGVVVANPVPAADEMPLDLYQAAIDGAIEEAAARGLTGRAVTPFLLDRVRERSGGKSLETNLALLRNNAAVAARLAVSLSRSVGGRRR